MLGLEIHRKSSRRWLWVLGSGMVLLGGLGVGIFWALFLTPLSDDQLAIPKLSERYRDPSLHFETRYPAGWTVQPVGDAVEPGVSIRPGKEASYAGVSEIMVRIRFLDRQPNSQDEFLMKWAEMFTSSERSTKNKKFSFETRLVDLLNGDKGVMSILDMQRFWIPMRQLAIFGFKPNGVLCSVSVSGLKSHMGLSKVLCLGVFETTKVIESPR